MKLAVVFVLLTVFQVTAHPLSGQTVTVSVKNVEIKKVLKNIEREGEIRFLFNSDLKDMKKKVDFSANNLPLNEALQALFNGTSLTFKTLENNLVVVLSTNSEENQSIRITGRVTGEKGEALAGASIQEKGTKNGTTTDNFGNYSLTVSDNATLVVSMIGYETQEIAVDKRSVIDVSLKLSAKKSEEVVVIGYGTAAKRDLTGSVAKVSGSSLASQPNTNPLASLQAKVTGLNIINDATPGSSPDVRIRGTISLGSIKPVYIIDGIFSDNMDFVNPNEIESVEILKDPSSLAVFGVKGAAGAILVTTKKAKAGQININFNTMYGSKKLVDKIALANGDEFRKLLADEANNRVFDDPSNNSLLNFVNNVGGAGLSAYTGNTDWIDAVTRRAAFTATNLSVDGSSDKNRFHVGLGYNTDQGLVNHTNYNRFTVNLNDEFKISNRWKLGFNLIVNREELPYNSGALENARRALPIIPSDTKSFFMQNPYGVDSGNYNLYATTPIIQNSETNPLATLEYNWNKRIDIRYRYVGNFFVDVNILKDLNFRATWYADISNRNTREYTPLYNLYDPTKIGTTSNPVFAKNILTAVRQEQTDYKNFQQDYILTYKKRFGDHSLTAMGGFTTYYSSFEQVIGNLSQSTPGVNIIPDNKRFWYLSTNFGDPNTLRTRSGQSEYATVSGLGRILYNYKNKYYLNASFRRDGASQINDDYKKKFQNFWALGGAWEMSKEPFLEKVSQINYLKLKASYGVLGNYNPPGGRAYPFYPTFSSTSSAVFGQTLVPAYSPDWDVDPNLKWETVNSFEAGFETDLLSNRLHLEFAYYNKKTKNLLWEDRRSGSRPKITNLGTIQNNGIELSGDWKQRINNDLTLTFSGNLTTYKNKVIYLQNSFRSIISSSEQTPNQISVGQPMGYYYGLVVEGIYQTYADILASPVSTINGGGAKPGDLKYKDLDGNGKIDEADRTNIGNPTPDFTYGFGINAKYKNFDLGIDFAGCYGNEIYRVWGTSEQKNSVYNYPQNYTEAWTSAGSSNWVPIVNQNHLINRAPSTYGVEDGSYFRIRNLNLGYTFNKLPKVTRIKNIRLFAAIQNLKTWKRNEGYSPEFAGSATGWGLDFGGAGSALPRITTFGVNVNF